MNYIRLVLFGYIIYGMSPKDFGLPRWLGGKEFACQAGVGVRSLGEEDPLEKEIATHSTILAWRIPWTEELGGPQSVGSQSQTEQQPD